MVRNCKQKISVEFASTISRIQVNFNKVQTPKSRLRYICNVGSLSHVQASKKCPGQPWINAHNQPTDNTMALHLKSSQRARISWPEIGEQINIKPYQLPETQDESKFHLLQMPLIS